MRTRAALDGPPGEGRLLGSRDCRGPPARLAGAGVPGQGRMRPQLRSADRAAAAGATARAGRRRQPQPAQRGARDRRQRTARGRAPRSGAPGPARAGRPAPARPRQGGPPRAHLLSRRRPRGRHGLPRAAPAGEHGERELPGRAGSRAPARGAAGAAVTLASFVNEPALELRDRAVRERLLEAMAALERKLPLHVAMLIGEGQREGEALASGDPGDPQRLIAKAPQATPADVHEAVAVARAAAPAWAQAPVPERAAALLRAAQWMRGRRLELAALCVRECAKPWPEADADVCEAIDHLEYNARGAIELDRRGALMQLPGERNSMRYAARGVCAVVAPWNFPIAIPTGMACAALATGNAVVLKPAEQAPACGAMVARALREGGVPAGVIGLLPGGGEVGAALVSDPRVDTIAFTGSAAVGQQIMRSAAEVRDGQRQIKRVIAAM